MRIDAHQHFWQLSRGDYTWMKPGDAATAPIQHDFLPHDLAPLLAKADVRHTVVVQAADRPAETEFLLSLARATPYIAAVVGWVDISRAQSAAQLASWAEQPKFKGVRPMLQDLPQVDWLVHAPDPLVIETMLRCNLCFDALVRTEHLPALQQFVSAWTTLPVVIDHAAKPPLARGGEAMQQWRAGMASLAKYPQVMCKVSGLMTELSSQQRQDTAAVLRAIDPLWQDLLQWFGASRLMWGSDWPVLNLASDYATWVRVSDTLMKDLSSDQRHQIVFANAARFYGLASAPLP